MILKFNRHVLGFCMVTKMFDLIVKLTTQQQQYFSSAANGGSLVSQTGQLTKSLQLLSEKETGDNMP